MMDERMCRPGYRWNDTLKRCLAAVLAMVRNLMQTEPPGEKPGVQAKPAKGGRGDVRVNANTQTGLGWEIVPVNENSQRLVLEMAEYLWLVDVPGKGKEIRSSKYL